VTGASVRCNEGLGAAPTLLSNPHPVLVHHPQSARKRLGLEGAKESPNDGEYVALVLPSRPQHDDPGVRPGRVGSNVGKSNIKGKEHPVLRRAGSCYRRVRSPVEPLISHRQRIVPGGTKNLNGL